MRRVIQINAGITLFNVSSCAKDLPLEAKEFLAEVAKNGCLCVDSIQTYNRSQKEIASDISHCINEQVTAYQLGSKLLQVDSKGKGKKKKKININLDMDENSSEYKSYYYEIERYMMDDCPSLKDKLAANEK